MSVLDKSVGRWSAIDQKSALNRREFSAVELLAETRATHERLNPIVNAVVTIDFAAAERVAAESDRRRANNEAVRPLEGLPMAVKDLEETAGMRTTFGSALSTDYIPTRDSLVVERLRAAGAVIYGKTNTPEYGTGSHTYNRVFGTTRNPYAPDRSAGGSSGGAAAALAAGLVSVADGSDMGGSLRNPASFCNVVGLRPSSGRVPNWPQGDAWDTLATNGPMGRTVGDTALLLAALSGGDPRAPLGIPESFPALVPELTRSLRIGWSRTLGGLDIDPRVTSVLETDGAPVLRQLGHHLIDLEPDFSGADESFRVLRGLGYARNFGDMLAQHREHLGAELIQNTEDGQRLTLTDFLAARDERTQVYARLSQLFEHIDVLAAPVTAVLPFPGDQSWPVEINGVEQRDYLEWMRASWRISLVGFAAISVPCGFSAEGLPVGLHLIAPPRHEALLLALAAQFEREQPVWMVEPTYLNLHSAHTLPQEMESSR